MVDIPFEFLAVLL